MNGTGSWNREALLTWNKFSRRSPSQSGPNKMLKKTPPAPEGFILPIIPKDMLHWLHSRALLAIPTSCSIPTHPPTSLLLCSWEDYQS